MSCTRETKTKQKHNDMYAYFIERQKSYGDLATQLPMNFLYDQVAEKFYCEPEYAGKVCRAMSKLDKK